MEEKQKDIPALVGIWLLQGAIYFLLAFWLYRVGGRILKLVFT